jgi:hypothetical protein
MSILTSRTIVTSITADKIYVLFSLRIRFITSRLNGMGRGQHPPPMFHLPNNLTEFVLILVLAVYSKRFPLP